MDFSVSSNYKSAFKAMDSLDLNMSAYNANNEDDQAESVDSGCVPDLTPETSWVQVSSALNYEYGFILSLLQHTTINKGKSSVTSSSPNKFGTVPSTSLCAEDKPVLKHEEENTNSNNNNTPSYNVTQRRKLEKELRRIKKGKLGNLSESEAPNRILEIQKQLKNIDEQKIKDKKSNNEQQELQNEGKLGNLSESVSPIRILETQKHLKDIDKQKIKNKKTNKEQQNEVNAFSSDTSYVHPIAQKKMLEKELRTLKKGKLGNLSASQAKKRESKIKKHLHVMEKQREKARKLAKREQNAFNVPSAGNMQKIYNSCGKLVYSKFDFSDSAKEKWTENNKSDLNSYMSKVIKEKEKIKNLKAEGKVNEAATYASKKLWNNAMKKAQGEKVRDNSQKLKKSMERKKHQKKKSAAKWNERVSTVKKFQEKKQEKRIQNMTARKQSKQQRSKGKKKKGKGKRVPGF